MDALLLTFIIGLGTASIWGPWVKIGIIFVLEFALALLD